MNATYPPGTNHSPPVPPTIPQSPPHNEYQRQVSACRSTPTPDSTDERRARLQWQSKWMSFRTTHLRHLERGAEHDSSSKPSTARSPIATDVQKKALDKTSRAYKPPTTPFSFMSREGLLDHVERLLTDFVTMRDWFRKIDLNQTSAEVSTGIPFILSLLDNYEKPDHIKEGEEPLEWLRRGVQTLDRVHNFSTQSWRDIENTVVQQALALQTPNDALEPPGGIHIETPDDSEQRNPREEHTVKNIIGSLPETRCGFVSVYGLMEYWDPPIGIPPPPPTHYETDSRGRGRYASGADSHRANQRNISTIAFFGAGVAWTTIFSGTRGDIVIISWAACCFLVSGISANSANWITDTDGSLVERFMPVRWTVRILLLFSAIHALAGIVLMNLAILALDPNAPAPSAGLNGGSFSALGERTAGAYSLCCCGAIIMISFIVIELYGYRTWFGRVPPAAAVGARSRSRSLSSRSSSEIVIRPARPVRSMRPSNPAIHAHDSTYSSA